MSSSWTLVPKRQPWGLFWRCWRGILFCGWEGTFTGLYPNILLKADTRSAGCSVSWPMEICISPRMESLHMLWAPVPVFGHLRGNSFFLTLSWITLPNHPHCLLSFHGAPLRRLYIFSVPSPQVVEDSNKLFPLPSLLQAEQTYLSQSHTSCAPPPEHLGSFLVDSLQCVKIFSCTVEHRPWSSLAPHRYRKEEDARCHSTYMEGCWKRAVSAGCLKMVLQSWLLPLQPLGGSARVKESEGRVRRSRRNWGLPRMPGLRRGVVIAAHAEALAGVLCDNLWGGLPGLLCAVRRWLHFSVGEWCSGGSLPCVGSGKEGVMGRP